MSDTIEPSAWSTAIASVRSALRRQQARRRLCNTLNIRHDLDNESIELFANTQAPHDMRVRELLETWLA